MLPGANQLHGRRQWSPPSWMLNCPFLIFLFELFWLFWDVLFLFFVSSLCVFELSALFPKPKESQASRCDELWRADDFWMIQCYDMHCSPHRTLCGSWKMCNLLLRFYCCLGGGPFTNGLNNTDIELNLNNNKWDHFAERCVQSQGQSTVVVLTHGALIISMLKLEWVV